MTPEKYNDGVAFFRQQLDKINLQKPFRYRVYLYNLGHRNLVIRAEQLEPTTMEPTNSCYITFSGVHVMYLCPSWHDVELELLDYHHAYAYLDELQITEERSTPGFVFQSKLPNARVLIQCSMIYISDKYPEETLSGLSHLKSK